MRPAHSLDILYHALSSCHHEQPDPAASLLLPLDPPLHVQSLDKTSRNDVIIYGKRAKLELSDLSANGCELQHCKLFRDTCIQYVNGVFDLFLKSTR